MSDSRTSFSKYSTSGTPYFVDVELIQIEKTELYCAMFSEITKMLLNTVWNSATARQFTLLSDDLALLWLAFGQDFQNTQCPAVPYFLNFESIWAE